MSLPDPMLDLEPVAVSPGPLMDASLRLTKVIADLRDKADQFGYLAGLKTEVRLVDPQSEDPIPKLKRKAQKDSAKAYRKILLQAAGKAESLLGQMEGKTDPEIETSIQAISEFLEQSLSIAARIQTPIPSIRAKVIRNRAYTPDGYLAQASPIVNETWNESIQEVRQPVLKNQEITELATGFPMLSSCQAMLRKDLWHDGGGIAIAEFKPYANPRNLVEHYISDPGSLEILPWEAAYQIIERLGFNTVKLQFVLAAEAVRCRKPWEETFVVKGSDLTELLGLGKDKRRTKSEQLLEVANTAFTLSCLWAKIKWIEQRGKKEIEADLSGQMWAIAIKTERRKQLDLFSEGDGPEGLDEIYLEVKPGIWTSTFLNKSGAKVNTALYQYGYVAKNILTAIDPLHDELALRLAIYLVVNSRGHTSGKYRVLTLLKAVLPSPEIEAAKTDRDKCRKLVNQWINALRLLSKLDWNIDYGAGYPDYLKADYRAERGHRKPKGYFEYLLNATITIRPAWQSLLTLSESSALSRKAFRAIPAKTPFTADQVRAHRKAKGWTQAELAARIGVDRSLISRWERGDRLPSPPEEAKLRSLLGL
jgi:DNA-binding transcriptional regulator YiaG